MTEKNANGRFRERIVKSIHVSALCNPLHEIGFIIGKGRPGEIFEETIRYFSRHRRFGGVYRRNLFPCGDPELEIRFRRERRRESSRGRKH